MKTKWELTVWRLKDRIKKGLSALNKVIRNNRDDSIDTVSAQITSEVNTILRGSKLVGDIKIANDLELSGDVEGNITSDKRSNITIKGNCRGSISTQKGNVEIEGAILNGDIVAGGYVKVRGKFNGGKIEAREKIYMDGEFTGLLQSNEIEVGPSSRGKGELLYTEHISIHKGARVDVQIRKIGEEQRETKRSAENKVIDLDVPFQQKST
jgi:cytoskeletal protein CcmA (bactofilin family)